MRLLTLHVLHIELPLVTPFRTSFGTERTKEALLVRAETPEAVGWGECVAMVDPLYSSEFLASSALVIRDHLAPRLLHAPAATLTAASVARLLEPVKGHPMAKAALEMAVLDAELRAAGMPLPTFLGSVRPAVDAGVSVGIMDTVPELLDAVEAYLAEGYKRIKLKIEPGWDLAPVRAVRERFGDDLLLQTDANTAYTLADARHLARLDPFDLLLIEQPLPEDDVRGHAELARQIRTPVCLDESITSARAAADAIALGACSVVNIKPGRVGGYLEARRIHDVCIAHGVAVWCGGMLETGLGRAANVALASLPGFVLPGDTSASSRFYAQDLITEPFVLVDGQLAVRPGPGIGVEVDEPFLASITKSTEVLTADGGS
jgi:O-succinylbenzoate synthase